MTAAPNPHMIAALKLVGHDPEVALLKTQLWELSQRIDDLAALVHAHTQAQPAGDGYLDHFGKCEHGRLLLRPCPDCNRTNR